MREECEMVEKKIPLLFWQIALPLFFHRREKKCGLVRHDDTQIETTTRVTEPTSSLRRLPAAANNGRASNAGGAETMWFCENYILKLQQQRQSEGWIIYFHFSLHRNIGDAFVISINIMYAKKVIWENGAKSTSVEMAKEKDENFVFFFFSVM